MITTTNSVEASRLVRWMILPLIILLTAGVGVRGSGLPVHQQVVKDTGKYVIDPVLHHYLRHLRYPDIAVEAGKEETIWFTVRVDKSGAVSDFQAYVADPDENGKMVHEVTVMSVSKTAPAGGQRASEANLRESFVNAARNASSDMRDAVQQPTFVAGQYLIKARFKIEKKSYQ